MTAVDSLEATSARFSWPRTAALHLGPAALAFTVALVVAPLLRVPQTFALTIAFAVVLTPLELGILARAARSLREVPSVLAFRGPLGRWRLVVPPLFAVALAMAAAWSPAGDRLGRLFAGILPGWALPSYDATHGFAHTTLIVTMLVTLVVDGITNPLVEELYFRGYLLPRLPVSGRSAIVVSAGLFTVQHYWQPFNWPLILTLELILTTLVVRYGKLRLGIVMHCLANSVGILLTLIPLLT
ncbi:CPBP family intramembrane glutamic endopeptidase [Actinoplanes sp. NPDC051411]|uniref:CPBP family intramembrane glutamic endopeptidase n=1 Tax=Actinoplanes sp. NPDC051411 TaxID=3155522 RepID=UPI0034463B95